MPKLIGIFNAPPVYVLGLRGLLESAGYALEIVTDPLPWLRRHRTAAVLVCVRDNRDLDVVVDLKAEDPKSVVITLNDEINVSTFQASLSAGAAGSIGRDAGAAEFVLTFNAAMSDKTVIPASIARTLASRSDGASEPSALDDHDLAWLKSLASGETVAELGNRIGFSEREMYRRLRRLYSRIGASGRTDALLKAARLGWLD